MFAIIGQIVVGLFLLFIAIVAIEIAREIYRAFKVTNIHARVSYGKGWRKNEKITVRKYLKSVKLEIFSGYTYRSYGDLKVYRNGKIGHVPFRSY